MARAPSRFIPEQLSTKLRAGSISLPAHAISTKNKHLLLACATNPRFHGGCFGVLGTPPPKPLNCKVWLNRFGALRAVSEDTPPATSLGSPALIFVLCLLTSSRCRSALVHSSVFPFASEFDKSGQQKTLLTCGKQGEKSSSI